MKISRDPSTGTADSSRLHSTTPAPRATAAFGSGARALARLVVPLTAVLVFGAGVVTAQSPPVIGVAKNASINGRQVTLDFYLESFSVEQLTDVGLVDDLDGVFGAGNFTIAAGPTLIDDPGTITVNGAFDGSNDTELISSGTLAVGATAQIRVVIDITSPTDQGLGVGVYSNQATVRGTEAMLGTTTDLSDNGTDPDPNGNGNPGDPGENDPTLIDITERPLLGAAKNATLSGNQVTFDLVLENLGNRALGNLSLPDDLDAVFGAGNYLVIAGPTLVDDPGTITVNGGFDGSSDSALITSGSLAAGDTAGIRVVVEVTTVTDQGAGLGVYSNQVIASGVSPSGTPVSDLSDAGSEPDPDGSGYPADPGEDDPTPIVIGEEPTIGVATTATVAGSSVTFDIYLENLGNVALSGLSLPEDLDIVFGAGAYAVTSGPTLVDDPGTITVNPAFDGSSDTALIASGTLAVGDTAQVQLQVQVLALSDQGLGLGSYRHQVVGTATAPGGTPTADVSDDGTDPDPNGNGDPTEAGENDPSDFTIAEHPVIGVSKTVQVLPSMTAAINVNGTNTTGTGPRVRITWYLENLGNVELSNVTLTDDLDLVFGTGNYGTIRNQGFPEILQDDGDLVRNTNYNGSTVTDVLNPGSSLSPGEVSILRTEALVINITDQGSGLGVYRNQATAAGDGPGGGMTSDLSDAGEEPDPNGNGDPGDAGEDDPFEFVVGSLIGAAKTATVNGTEVTFDLYLETFGSLTLSNLSLSDNLEAVFGTGNYNVAVAPTLIDDPGTLVLNPAFDGASDPELLAPGSTLAGGDTAQIRFTVQVLVLSNQGYGLGVYRNQALAEALQAGGVSLFDASDDGTDPDPNGDGDPTQTGENDPTSFTVTSDAVVGVAKTVTVAGNTVTVDLYLESFGSSTATDLSLVDDLDSVFGAAKYTLTSPPALIADPGTLVLNGAYDGSVDVELLAAGSSLTAGATAQIRFVVDVTSISDPAGLGLGVYSNQAMVQGTDSAGVRISDLSDDGTDPDFDGNGDPTDPGLAEPPVDGNDDPSRFLIGQSALGAALHSFVQGTQITYDYYLENLGDHEITSISVSQNLFAVLGFGNYSVVSPPARLDGPSTIAPFTSFDGTFAQTLVNSGSLAPGEWARIRFVINVTNVTDQGDGLGVYLTQFTANGLSPLGTLLTDASDDGVLSDPNGDGDPTGAGENDETLSIIGEGPALGVAKAATVAGSQVTFDYVVENLGNVTLSGLTMADDLDAVFGAGNFSFTSISSVPAAFANPAFDGSSEDELINQTPAQSLTAGATATITVVANVTTITDQGLGTGSYSNQVIVAGTGPSATVAQDRSDDGADPDPNGNGNPADAGEGDQTLFSLSDAAIGAAKAVAAVSGRDVSLHLVVENLGNTRLEDVSLTDDLDASFGAGNYVLLAPPAIVTSPRELALNPGFDGSSDTELIASGGLEPGVLERIQLVVRVLNVTDQGSGAGTYLNQAIAVANGVDPDLSDDGTDPDPDGDGIPSEPGEDDPTTIVLGATIGDRVWNDLDGDGVQDAGEPGIAGVIVRLGGSPTATSGADGGYDVAVAAPGTYTLDVDPATVPTGFVLTGGASPLPVTVTAGEDFNLADFGYQQQDASIGDLVWNDLDGDGVYDAGEPGLAAVTVYLDLNSTGTLDGGEPSAVSDGGGVYNLTNLATGTYPVRVDESTVTTGFVLTGGTLPQIVSLTAGENFNDADFGYQQQDASIGDFVWNDLNGDGVADGGEPGLAGVTVFLDLNSNGSLDGGEPSDTTDGAGAYDLTELATGSYTVRVDAATVPAGFVLTSGTDPQSVALATSEDFNDADFGYQQQDASIGDLVWNDLNGNGVQDPGEPGLAGVTVFLDLNSNGSLDGGEPSDITDTAGAYDLTELATGTYSVRVDVTTVPTGFVLTGGTDPQIVPLAAGEDFNDADFGYRAQADLALTGTDTPDPVFAGTPLTLGFEVTNNGPAEANGLGLLAVLPDDATFTSSTAGCTQPPELTGMRAVMDGSQVVPANASTATGLASFVLDTTSLELWFAVHVTDLSGITVAHVHSGAAGVNGPVVHWLYSGTPTFDPDAPISGRIQLSPAEADALLANPHYVAVHTTVFPGGEIRGQLVVTARTPLRCDLASLTVGSSHAFDVVTEVVPEAADGSTLDTVAIARTSALDPDQVALPAPNGSGLLTGATVRLSTSVVADADLSVVIDDSQDPVSAGGAFSFTVGVTNDGPAAAATVTATLTLPAELAVVQTNGCAEDPAGVPTCSLGTLGPGDSATFTVAVGVLPAATPGVVTTGVAVASHTVDSVPGNNSDAETTTLDATPPTVLAIDTLPTSSGALTDCEELRTRPTAFTVRFSEPVLNPAGDSDPSDVTNPANYLLVEAGADHDLATLACGMPAGDDLAIPVTSVSYDAGTDTATLNLGDVTLADAPYRLLVCGSTSIRDLAGAPLDGDGDGTGGDDFVRTFRIERESWLVNGHFDCSISGWQPVSTLPEEIEHEPAEDVDGAWVSGSARITNLSASTDFSLGQCADLVPALSCAFRLGLKLEAAPGDVLIATRVCEYFTEPACTGASLGVDAGTAFVADTGGAWASQQLATSSPAGAASVVCSLDLQTPSGAAFTAFVDSAELVCTGGLVFANGFESGDTSAWTITVP